MGKRFKGGRRPEVDLSAWHALQRWLELAGIRDVAIPYAEDLGEKVSDRAVRMRRDMSKILTLISAHAMLHQLRREQDDNGCIVATLADYTTIYQLVNEPIGEAIDASASNTVRETVETVAELLEEQGPPETQKPITLRQLAEALQLDRSTVSRRARVARGKGYLLNEEERRGMPLQLVLGDPLPKKESALPEPLHLCTDSGGIAGKIDPAPGTSKDGKSVIQYVANDSVVISKDIEEKYPEDTQQETIFLNPSRNAAKVQRLQRSSDDDLALTCCICGAPVEYYGPAAEPYCEEHAPEELRAVVWLNGWNEMIDEKHRQEKGEGQ
jgi:hypothetical protein